MKYKNLITIFLGLFFIGGVAIYYSYNQSIEKMAGQMIMTGFHGDGMGNNPEEFSALEHQIKTGKIGGVILFDVDVSGLLAQGMDITEAKKQIFSSNVKNTDQVKKLNSHLQSLAPKKLLIAVDQEGGQVQRLKSEHGFAPIPSAKELGSGDITTTYETAYDLGKRLSDLGFNVDFAPIADVVTNGNNTFLKKRAFGTDPERVKELVYLFSQQLLAHGVLPCYKHFPGLGGTNDNSHFGYATVNRTLEQFEAAEFVPFRDAGEKGIPFIMCGHILVPAISDDRRPASLSKTMLTDILRNRLGFQGIIICDALVMDAVRNDFSSCRSGVEAIKAGCDMIMKPGNFRGSVNAVIEAVENGEISEARIDESVNRILRIKCGL